MFQSIVATLLMVVCFISPVLGEVTTPLVAKECISLGNAFNTLHPDNPALSAKSTYDARVAITKHWTDYVNQNPEALDKLQAQILSAKASIIATPLDGTNLYNGLHAAGSNITLEEVQKNVKSSTAGQRKRILDAIENQGLSNVLGSLTGNINPFLSSDGRQPQDGYCYLMQVAQDMFALAAILALWQPEAALAMASLAGALYFYATYVDCYFDPDGGEDFFTD